MVADWPGAVAPGAGDISLKSLVELHRLWRLLLPAVAAEEGRWGVLNRWLPGDIRRMGGPCVVGDGDGAGDMEVEDWPSLLLLCRELVDW